MFNGRERVASYVIRWSTTPRMKDQSVADHSFYVTLYSKFICELMYLDNSTRLAVLEWALVHDLPENVLGDWPGPAKRRIITDRHALAILEAEVMNEMGLLAEDPMPLAVNIVKVANIIDELFYLQNEENLGNKYVHHVFHNSWTRFVIAYDKLGASFDLPSMIRDELNGMANGIVTLKSSEDQVPLCPHGKPMKDECQPCNDDIPF